jgi:uncharacterized membrane protein (UPF0127 family)
MTDRVIAPRLRPLSVAVVCGREVRVARSRLSRLAGLAGLRRERAGGGLLIPRCRSIHTFGMRFRLDVLFIGPGGDPLDSRRAVAPWRIVRFPPAAAVLEVPAADCSG